MNSTDKRQNYDMSMEDILASIRKYVSDEDAQGDSIRSEPREDKAVHDEKVIKLNESQVIDEEGHQIIKLNRDSTPKHYEDPTTYEEVSTLSQNVLHQKREEEIQPQTPQKGAGTFDKLTDALKSYGRNSPKMEKQNKTSDITLDQFLSSIADKAIGNWIEENLRKITEELVLREIEKIKSE